MQKPYLKKYNIKKRKLDFALVCLGCCNRIPQTWQLNQMCKIKVSSGLVPGEDPLFTFLLCLAVLFLCGESKRAPWRLFLIRQQSCQVLAPLLCPHLALTSTSLKALSENAVTSRVQVFNIRILEKLVHKTYESKHFKK